MDTALRGRLDPRQSFVPAAVVLLLGTLAHAVEQAVAFRAGPVSALATAPVFATLLYLAVRDESVEWRRLLALLGWGFVSTGVAVLAVVVIGLGQQLPRPLTGLEMIVYDLGLFLWLVCALGAVYAAAGRNRGRRAVGTLLSAPLVQGLFALLPLLLVAGARLT